MEGDMDIIRREVNHSKNPRLLMTLEPMIPGNYALPKLVKEVSLSQLSPGKSFTFVLPESIMPQHLGLYICLDSAGTNTCRNKMVTDLANLDKNFAGQSPDEENRQFFRAVSDKVYFFHYFLLEGQSLMAFDNLMEKSSYPTLRKYLENRLGDSNAAGDISAQLRQLNGTIASMPAKVTRQFVQINLPRYERGECEKRKIKFPKELMRKLQKKGVTIDSK